MKKLDVVVVGAGPAGLAAALEAASRGARVGLVEMAPRWASNGVVRGELAVRTLRESALSILRSDLAAWNEDGGGEVEIAALVEALDQRATDRGGRDLAALEAAGVRVFIGRARLLGPGRVAVSQPFGAAVELSADAVVWCSGERPVAPPDVPIDHEHIMDSDSVLSLLYLPRSLLVLGGGPRVAVFATIFASLGVQVTVLDPNARPLPEHEREQNQALLRAFERRGCRWIQRAERASCAWDGLDVVVHLANRREHRARKALVIGGIAPGLRGLRAEKLGVDTLPDGFLAVDDRYATSLDRLFAAGAVTGHRGPPCQHAREGRQAAAAALGGALDLGPPVRMSLVPGLPAMASVGVGEAEQAAAPAGALCASADLAPLPGSGAGERGRLKLVADAAEGRLRGAHAVGEGAEALVLALRDAVATAAPIEALHALELSGSVRAPIRAAAAALCAERDRFAERGPRSIFGGALRA